MALQKTDTTVMASTSPYQLDPDQTLRAANALLKKMQSDISNRTDSNEKKNLLQDSDEIQEDPIWLYVTSKKYIVDKPRLKPGKIFIPNSLHRITPSTDDSPDTKVCLLTADPQRMYKDLISHPDFPTDTGKAVSRVLGLAKLKARYKSFESRRQLFGEYDIFLADDRIITYLPKLLGKVFYHTGAKRPIPVNLLGKKDSSDMNGNKRVALSQGGTKAIRDQVTPKAIANEIERALGSALVHLSPGTNTSIKIGTTSMTAEQVNSNIEAVMTGLVDKYIPKGWKNIKSLHIKGPNTVSLPIWLADELWEDEADVLEKDAVDRQTLKRIEAKAVRSEKRKASIEGQESSKKRKSNENDKDEQKMRKQQLKRLKEETRDQIGVTA